MNMERLSVRACVRVNQPLKANHTLFKWNDINQDAQCSILEQVAMGSPNALAKFYKCFATRCACRCQMCHTHTDPHNSSGLVTQRYCKSGVCKLVWLSQWIFKRGWRNCMFFYLLLLTKLVPYHVSFVFFLINCVCILLSSNRHGQWTSPRLRIVGVEKFEMFCMCTPSPHIRRHFVSSYIIIYMNQ